MMRHIYNAGDGSGDSFDKDDAWASCMESSEAGPVQPVRWVTMPAAQPDHHPTLMPDYSKGIYSWDTFSLSKSHDNLTVGSVCFMSSADLTV